MGMRINSNSWHYRLNRDMYGSDVPKSLCPYFWATIFSIFVLSWLSLIIKAFDHVSLPRINIGLFRFFEKHRTVLPFLISGGLAGYGAISFFVYNDIFGIWNMALGSVLFVWSKYSTSILKRAFTSTYKIPTKEKQPSIFKEYVKAKHHSVCPTLEFIDFKKEDFNRHVEMIKTQEKDMAEEAHQSIKELDKLKNKYNLTD